MMMLTWNLAPVAQALGYANANVLTTAIQQRYSINHKSVYAAWNGEARRMDIDSLGAICATLGVPVSTILVFAGEDSPDGYHQGYQVGYARGYADGRTARATTDEDGSKRGMRGPSGL
jgi:DNA-binding Xre family transcriptional regulator